MKSKVAGVETQFPLAFLKVKYWRVDSESYCFCNESLQAGLSMAASTTNSKHSLLLLSPCWTSLFSSECCRP